MNYSLTGMQLLVILLIVLLPILTIALILAWAILRLMTLQQKLMKDLLTEQRQESQSLRNQLRSSDVQSLMAMQQATGVPQSSVSEEQYIPTYDEGVTYQEAFDGAGLQEQGIGDDLNARGWESVTTTDRGPVKFG